MRAPAEQVALAAAIEFFELYRDEMSIKAGRELAQFRLLARSKNLALLRATADFGDRDADDMLRKLAADTLKGGGILPDHLRYFVIEVLLDARPRRTRRGRRPSDQDARNLYLIMAVHLVVEHGFPPTRNRESRGASACSIVAKAFNMVTGGNLDEAAVAKIWETKWPWLSREPSETKGS